MTPNPSFERTRNGIALGPRSARCHDAPRGPSAMPQRAAQLKRWAMPIQIPPRLCVGAVHRAERGGTVLAGRSPFGSQRTLFAPHSGWCVTAGEMINASPRPSIPKRKCFGPNLRAGCPSSGGQRTAVLSQAPPSVAARSTEPCSPPWGHRGRQCQFHRTWRSARPTLRSSGHPKGWRLLAAAELKR